MPRYPQPLELDEPVTPELDAGFRGINQRADRGQLQPGYLWDAQNIRLDLQTARTRPGCVLPVHFNHVPRVSILGAGIYNDARGQEWVVICEPRRAWLCADGWQPIELSIPAGRELTGQVEVIQCGAELRILRGADEVTMTWNGDRLIPQFRELPPPSGGPAFLERQPDAEWAVLMADRLWVPISTDELAWSDLLDFSAFDPTLASVRFNQVQDDALVAAVPYQQTRMVVFKTRSAYVLTGVFGDLSEMRVDRVPASEGCIARRSIAVVGADVIYLARGGVHILRQAENETLLRGIPVPLSHPVPRWMNRISWDHAHQACACVCGDYYQLAVPVDGSTRNNAVLCYHLPTAEWHSLDFYGDPPASAASIAGVDSTLWTSCPWTGPSLPIMTPQPDLALNRGQAFVVTRLFGQQTALLVDGQRVLALGHGDADRLDADRPVHMRVETRGYTAGELTSKQVRRVVAAFATRAACVSLTVTSDGVREDQTLLSEVRRDPTRPTRVGLPEFALNNADSRVNSPHREDYRWKAGDGLRLGAGVRLADHQTFERAVPVARECRWLACRFESTEGTAALVSLQAEGLPSKNHLRTKS